MSLDRSEAFDRNALIVQLESMGQRVKGNSCTCPWHEDLTPSAGIFEDDTGHWRVKCHSRCGGRVDDIYGLRGEKPSMDQQHPVKVARIERKPAPQVVLADKNAVKEYCERTGEVTNWYKYGGPEFPVLIVARIKPHDGSKKQFRQFTPAANGTYAVGKSSGVVPPVYMHHQIKHVDRVLVVEGEKCADAAWTLGIPATTSCGGSSGTKATDWATLAGKTVVLWPDNDEAGVAYMDEVSKILTGLDCIISRIDPESVGIPEKGDLADMVAKGVSKEAIEEFMDDAAHVGESGVTELLKWQQDVVDGKWECLDWPQRYLGVLSRAALPGTVTMICADPGAGKSFLMLQLLRFWTQQGHKASVILFEDGKKEHLARLLAQMTENGEHTDDKWIKANPDEMRRDTTTHLAELTILDRKILVEKDDDWSGEDVLAWADAKGKAGARVLMLDPITALKPAKDPWIQDFTVCMGLKRIAKKYQCSVIVTTHPRNGTKEPSMTAMAGGVAWSRFTHSVLWLTGYRTPWEVRLINGEHAQVNRSMHILKCRYGRGCGVIIGMNFGASVRHIEVGIIAPDTGEETAPPTITAEEKASRAQRAAAAPSESENKF